MGGVRRVHDADLAGRRVGPQQVARHIDVERVPQVARRVVGRDVEHLEVASGRPRPRGSRRPRSRTGRRSRRSRAWSRCSGWSVPRRMGRPGSVTSTASAREPRLELRRREARVPRSRDRRLDRLRTSFAMAPTRGRSSRRQRADAAQDAGQLALLAEDIELAARRAQPCRARRRSPPALVAQRLQVARQVARSTASSVSCGRGLRNHEPPIVPTSRAPRRPGRRSRGAGRV